MAAPCLAYALCSPAGDVHLMETQKMGPSCPGVHIGHAENRKHGILVSYPEFITGAGAVCWVLILAIEILCRVRCWE